MHAKFHKLESVFHDVLSPLGFRLQKNCWRRRCPEVIQIIRLQRIDVSNAWFNLDCGIHVPALAPDMPVNKTKPHLRWVDQKFCDEFFWQTPVPPLRRMTNEERVGLHHALNLEWDETVDPRMTSEHRAALIQAALRTYLIPCLEAHATLAAVQEHLRHRCRASWPACSAMPRVARQILELGSV